ncbi:hypothetical protein BJ742DRAFT_261191 [Cladochytrium replicatum]|nr:hypothetical protein BJ742DRAFT_261191 [Cladochytrium replicatum]
MGNICASVDKHDSARELHTSPPQQNEKQPSGEAFTTVDDVDFQTIGSEPTTPNSGGDEKPFSCQSIATFQDASGTGKIHLLEGNVMQRTPFEDNIFDYVHQQYLVLGLPEAAWPAVIFELCRVLKPGGYLDLVDWTESRSGKVPKATQHKSSKTLSKPSWLLLASTSTLLHLSDDLFLRMVDTSTYDSSVGSHRSAGTATSVNFSFGTLRRAWETLVHSLRRRSG